MKKCYIAGNIGNLPVNEYEFNFAQAMEEVRAMGMEPICPLNLPHNHGKTWREYMREDLIAMLGCEVVYCLRNWRDSPGAKIEIDTALKVGLDIIQQESIKK